MPKVAIEARRAARQKVPLGAFGACWEGGAAEAAGLTGFDEGGVRSGQPQDRFVLRGDKSV